MSAMAELQSDRQRPICSGVAITTGPDSAGTLGSVVFDRSTGGALLLGADHVFTGALDGRVWQPLPCGTAGCDCNVVGRVLRGRRSVVPWGRNWYYIDAAVAAIEPGVEWQASVSDVAILAIGARVGKLGARGTYTPGVIVDDRHVERVLFGFFEMAVPNQLLIRPTTESRFAAEGDSGALVCDDERRAVGLLWGVTAAGFGVACPIGPILDQLNIRFGEEGT